MNEDRLFHETEKKKGLSIKLDNLFSLGGKTFLYIYKKKKDEKPKLTVVMGHTVSIKVERVYSQGKSPTLAWVRKGMLNFGLDYLKNINVTMWSSNCSEEFQGS